MTHLVACPSCTRHVRVSESSCPFCHHALSDAVRATPEPRGPAVRLSRGALYAFGVGALTVATACSSSSPAQVIVPYGVPPQPDCIFPDGIVEGSKCDGTVYVEPLSCASNSCQGSSSAFAYCTGDTYAAMCGTPPDGYTLLRDAGIDSAH
jgi:hypothetical protein